jgi:hypothetical protein
MAQSPRARKTGLIIETLPEEVLVYDLDRDQALCLNHTAALVWKQCDGKTTPERMARVLEKEFQIAGGDEIVSLALERLERSHLLTGKVPTHLPGVSRRQLVQRLGIVAAVPVITLMLVPTAKAQASCTPNEGGCESNAECCSGCCAQGTCLSLDFCLAQ